MILLALVLAGWTLLVLAPETPVAAWLRRWTVEAPARRLLAVRPATMIALALVALLVTAAWAFESEGFRILASAAPEAATWLSMIEVGTLVDAAMAEPDDQARCAIHQSIQEALIGGAHVMPLSYSPETSIARPGFAVHAYNNVIDASTMRIVGD